MRKKGSLNHLSQQDLIGKRIRTTYVNARHIGRFGERATATAIVVDKNQFDEFSKLLIDLPFESPVIFGAYIDSPLPGCQLIKLNWIREVLEDVPIEELLTHCDPLVREIATKRMHHE